MIIGYARVSTGEQTLDMQTDALEDYGCDRIYTEQISGAAKTRPELVKAMDALRDGDTFVVWRLDRLGRSTQDLVSKIDEFSEQGVSFVSIQDPIDTTTAQGKLIADIFAALAEFERNLTRERTMAGLKAARERGRVGGRPPALSDDEIPQVQALMRDPDVSAKQICDRFDISKTTLYRTVSPDGEVRK